MWQSNSALLLEILGGLLLALYLLRRITLTILYCIILVKAVFHATRRKYRRGKIHWRHFRNYNPHGFCARIAENIFYFLVPSGLRTLMARAAQSFVLAYRRAEIWATDTIAPWIYKKLPVKGQKFCDWIIVKVGAFQQKQRLRRRANYAVLSHARWQKRQMRGQSGGVCPMRYLMPNADLRHQRTGQPEL